MSHRLRAEEFVDTFSGAMLCMVLLLICPTTLEQEFIPLRTRGLINQTIKSLRIRLKGVKYFLKVHTSFDRTVIF